MLISKVIIDTGKCFACVIGLCCQSY